MLELDTHSQGDGTTCPHSGRSLNPDVDTPHCECGHLITLEGGLDPGDLLPQQLHHSTPLERVVLPEPRVCPRTSSWRSPPCSSIAGITGPRCSLGARGTELVTSSRSGPVTSTHPG